MGEQTSSPQVAAAQKELVTEFTKHREALWQAVYFRLDHRLSGRVDPDDVLQEAYLDAAKRLNQFVEQHDSWSMLVWIRVILRQTLINVHRRHFMSKKRDASREAENPTRTGEGCLPAITEECPSRTSTPSQVVMRKESCSELQSALDQLKVLDRTVLVLRHFEELSNKDTANRLGVSEKAASIRYVRAIEKLKKAMDRGTLRDGATS